MAKVTAKGRYVPKHTHKYVGDFNKIVYRSSWEHEFCKFLDNNPNVLRWASEEIVIPYVKPTDGQVHRYYPDFYMEYKDKEGVLIKEVIEVKPKAQTQPPKTVGKNKKQQLYESITFAINIAKWKAAQQFCDKYGLRFRIITEMKMFK